MKNTANILIIRELLPPPISSCDITCNDSNKVPITLLHTALTRVGRVFLCLCLSLFLLVLAGCEKEVMRFQEMVAYHAESLNLPAASADSVCSFTHKVQAFVSQHPVASEDPLYPQIQQNIRKAQLRLNITINDEWDGENHVNY